MDSILQKYGGVLPYNEKVEELATVDNVFGVDEFLDVYDSEIDLVLDGGDTHTCTHTQLTSIHVYMYVCARRFDMADREKDQISGINDLCILSLSHIHTYIHTPCLSR